MSIIVNKDSNVLVQGFTGSEGTFHSEQMIEYGTNVVCGVTPGKGVTKHLDKPVYNSVADALKSENINTSIIFVPPMFAADAIMEAAEANIETIPVVFGKKNAAIISYFGLLTSAVLFSMGLYDYYL